jgi:hypothetical protein
MPPFRYLGLAELVRPSYFAALTGFFVDFCDKRFDVSLEIDQISLNEAADYYQQTATRLLHPNVLNVLETYVHSITKNLKVSATPRDLASEIDPEGYTAHFCRLPSECLAVFSAAFLFANETDVDLEQCGFEHASLLEIARRMQSDPNKQMFDAPAFHTCRAVARARSYV